jgi:hypothetical protein
LRLRRLGLAAGVAALLAVGTPSAGAPAQDDAPEPTFAFVSANSGGDGVRVFFDIVGFLPITPAVSLASVSAEGFVETSRRTAVALLPDPGGTVVSAPGLAAGLVGVPNIPGYPLVARADDPFVPTADASPLLGSGVGVIRAEASSNRAAAVARLAGVGAGGATGLEPVTALVDAITAGLGAPLTGGLIDVGSSEVQVEETQSGPSTLTARATSRLAGVNLLGGLVRIASIETTASADLARGVASAAEPTVRVAGVTVAGIPAAIDEHGLSLAGSSTPLGALLGPLTDPLLDQGLAVSLAPSERMADGSTARARSGGLSIELTTAYQGYPVILRVTLGEVRASVQASGPPTAGPAPAVTGGGAPSSPAVGAPGALDLPSPLAPAAVGGAARPVSSPGNTAIVEFLDLRDVYPFLVLLAAGLAGSRLLASSLLRRRPGSRPEVQELFRW